MTQPSASRTSTASDEFAASARYSRSLETRLAWAPSRSLSSRIARAPASATNANVPASSGNGIGVVALDVRHQLDESGHEERHDRQDDPRRPGLRAYRDAFGRGALGFGNAAAAGGEQGRACHPPDVEQDADRSPPGRRSGT